jgi:hypothetical protein
VVLIATRQHYFYSDQGERHIIDMVFHDPEENILYLVEIKLGKLITEHYQQIQRYLDHVAESSLLSAYHLDAGAVARGMLATIEPYKFYPEDKDILVRVVNSMDAMQVLKRLRAI